MAYDNGTLTIYSNDGLRIEFESNGDLSLDEFHVVEEGVAGEDTSYVYSGGAKFLGLAREPYATVATYGVGDTFVIGQSTAEIFYIVEDTTVANLVNTTWYVSSGWTATAGYGIFHIGYTNLDTGVEDAYLCIGYDSYVPKEDTDEMMPYPGNDHIIGGMMFLALNVHTSEGFYIHITGGTDEQNPNLISWLSTYGTQLTIDDLTDTAWYVGSGWSATAGYGHFSVDCTCDVEGIGALVPYSLSIGYRVMDITFEPYANWIDAWTNTGAPLNLSPSYGFAVSFTSGTDVKNPALIAWLLEYGTQLKVADLTNTTWTVNEGWEAESGYGHFVGINGYYTTSLESNVGIKGIAIGYDRIEEDAITPTHSSISFGKPEDEYFHVLEDGEPFVLSITGGNAVGNPKLIAWLSTYGVIQQKHPYKFTKLVVGTTASSSESFAFRRLATAVRLYAPTITETGKDGELLITNNASNGNNVDKWAIYKADGTFVKHVDYTADEQIVFLNFGVQYYVKAVDASGAESPASNLATTKQCFVAGTPVLMADGTYKMIEEIQAGDLVQSYDIETSEFCDGEVTEVVTGYTDRIAMVLFSDGNYVAMAEGHPLYTEDGWHSITNKDGYPTLVVGDKVLGACGFVEIVDLSVVDTEPTMVYSLAVSAKKKTGLYFVGAGISAAHS